MNKTINDLPNELLAAIFNRLNQDSLNMAVLACKKWKELIEHTCRWTLYLNLKRTVVHKFNDFMLTTNRRFHSIRLNWLQLGNIPSTIQIFEKHGTFIKELFLFHCTLDNFATFRKIMACVPNLERLTIFEMILHEQNISSEIEVDIPNMVNLKTLNLVGMGFEILKYFNQSKIDLETVNIFRPIYMDPQENPKPLTDFLKTQQNLKKITLRRIKLSRQCELFGTDKLNEVMPFQLAKLTLRNFELGHTADYYNNVLQFMKFHANSIKELDIGDRFPDFIYTFVFTQLNNLDTLHMDIDTLSKETVFHTNLRVTNVTLRNGATNYFNRTKGCPNALKNFVRHFKNVTNLTLKGVYDKTAMLLIANNLKNIKKLYVSSLRGSSLKGVQFAELQRLTISQIIVESVDWNQFTKDNTHITELIIKADFSAKKFNTSDIANISRNLKLQKLTIGYNFRPDARFFEIIRNNCPDLRVVTLDEGCASGVNSLGDIPGLRLRFVDNDNDVDDTPFLYETDEDDFENDIGESSGNDTDTEDDDYFEFDDDFLSNEEEDYDMN